MGKEDMNVDTGINWDEIESLEDPSNEPSMEIKEKKIRKRTKKASKPSNKSQKTLKIEKKKSRPQIEILSSNVNLDRVKGKIHIELNYDPSENKVKLKDIPNILEDEYL
jgi:hypothetical protein